MTAATVTWLLFCSEIERRFYGRTAMILGTDGSGGAYLIITRRHVYAILMSPRRRYGLSVSLLPPFAMPCVYSAYCLLITILLLR